MSRKIIKITSTFSIVLGLALPTLVHAAIQADSTITQVTVYPDSARITRTATLSLPAGENKLILPGLPLELDAASLRVSGTSNGNVLLGSVQLAEQLANDVVQERERQLQDEIRRWQEKRQEVADAKTRAEQQLSFIRATGLQQKDKDAPAQGQILPLEQWQQAWQVLEAATADAQSKVRTADKTLQEFDQGLAQLQRQLEQIATGETSNRTATLHVNAEQATQLNLSLHYQIPAASWTPVYEAELDSSSGKLNLKTQAQIQQLTGEDWSNVKVNLSTLRPSHHANLPELNSWVVSLDDPLVFHAASAGMENYAADAAVMAEATPQAAPAAPAPMPIAKAIAIQTSTLVSSDYNAEYQVPGDLTLASGSDSRRVTLETRTLDSELTLRSFPRQDPRAILTAETTYAGAAPLIPGPVALYRDGNFIGNSQLEALQTGEQLKLSFGEDDRVKITFQPTPEKTSQPGLLSSRKRLDHSYTVTVANQHEAVRSITLYDTIPVGDTSDISVSLTGDTASLHDIDDKKGVMAWIRDIPAAGSVKLNYGYTISYPQDKQLSGL